MADVSRGLPLLSGVPPSPNEPESSCRKCSKEFNIIFARSRRCNHCGYSYCHSCSDYLALMPRSGNEAGYDAQSVCGYCIEYLNITAAGRGQLRSMPLGKLRKYVTAYNIRVGRVVEKDDLIDKIMSVRGPNGCLPPECEAFYRRCSVPARPGVRPRGFFSSRSPDDLPPATTQIPQRQPTQEFARPDLAADDPPPVPPRYQPPPGPPPRPPPQTPPRPQYYHPPPPAPPRPQPQAPPPNNASRPWGAYPGQSPYANQSASHSSQNFSGQSYNTTPPRQRAASSSPPSRASQAPPPTLDELLAMSEASMASLSIGNLKSILFSNHVNAGLILEKAELVKKVHDLVEDERRERERMERQHQLEEEEERERIRLQREEAEQEERRRRERAAQEAEAASNTNTNQDEPSASTSLPTDTNMERETSNPSPPPKSEPIAAPTFPKSNISAFERNGLCVICQDEEANIAIVDCGHLAMCRGCSDLIMASSRECPLCRTRIVTEARLLRIFKT
ncbi:hypothetical protein EYR40_010822 [Pleurotus pulmonarius]|nr:hypothetical protein EYR36_002593 [Pleurotus pulmonarius]KAF4586806.1 hypothetical protein EYR40_010822 [Pleurotus pulmonarius]